MIRQYFLNFLPTILLGEKGNFKDYYVLCARKIFSVRSSIKICPSGSQPTIIPHINSETNSPPPMINVVGFQYPAKLSRGKGLVYFGKVDHSRISINFSRN